MGKIVLLFLNQKNQTRYRALAQVLTVYVQGLQVC